ncbi:hypothetical protein N656DRAFT_791659 [Canariomyces notabilis]|uniref:Heterokaryon incompatibility domain-containing protein n=1 Tax=Canariomyces notabilis TaxID=2074819 RepID=A0AAN6QGI4_9PEZI|nr:hypothetical protein N656DRAFT_791659 [Canariomyces arenarius]
MVFLGQVRFMVYRDSLHPDDYPLLLVVVMADGGRPLPPESETPYNLVLDPWKHLPGQCLVELDICIARWDHFPLEPSGLPNAPSSTKNAAKFVKERTNLPTRVIDVGDQTKQPRLHVSRPGETGRWVALSYCWGGDSSFILTKESFRDLQSGIALSVFPATLRDAVVVTRALQVPYLWIDCLCIFQDDLSDWAAEAPKMSEIYSQAVVTIAAASADAVTDGFLHRRAMHVKFPIPWRSEEVLSTRLLCYTTERMIWRCRTGLVLEGKEELDRLLPNFSLFAVKRHIYPIGVMDSGHSTDDDDGPARTNAYSAWYTMMEGYSSLRLTYDSDRLPAISAVAKLFQASLQDDYLAGLWRRELPYGLLWGCKDHIQIPTENLVARRIAISSPGPCQGPSWSWQVQALTYTAKVVSAEILGKLGNDFGRIEGVKLVLEAPCKHLHLWLDSYTESSINPVCLTEGALEHPGPMANTKKLLHLVLARPELLAKILSSRSAVVSNRSTEFTLIQIAKTVARQDVRVAVVYFLLLEPRGDEEHGGWRAYRRVGILELQPWSDDDEPYNGEDPEEMTSRLEGAAFEEVMAEEWPRETFTII